MALPPTGLTPGKPHVLHPQFAELARIMHKLL